MSSPELVTTQTKSEEELPRGYKLVRGKALFPYELLREHAQIKSKLAFYIGFLSEKCNGR